jgi:hypothetical protein
MTDKSKLSDAVESTIHLQAINCGTDVAAMMAPEIASRMGLNCEK